MTTPSLKVGIEAPEYATHLLDLARVKPLYPQHPRTRNVGGAVVSLRTGPPRSGPPWTFDATS